MPDLFATHRSLLDRALERRAQGRTTAALLAVPPIDQATAKAQVDALHDRRFPLPGIRARDWLGAEASPYGVDLGIRYPVRSTTAVVAAASAAQPAWRATALDRRVGIALEAVRRWASEAPLLAGAAMHGSGQPWPMAAAGGTVDALERGLDALAAAYETLRTGDAQPAGVAAVLAGMVSPAGRVWPSILANLVCGNVVVVAPQPAAVLALALSVRTFRDVLAAAGAPADAVQLAVAPGAGGELARDPAIRVIDDATAPVLGVNPVVIESTRDLDGLLAGLARAITRFSGQGALSPRVVLAPSEGAFTDRGPVGFLEMGRRLAAAVDRLLADQSATDSLCGALRDAAVLDAITTCRGYGRLVRASTPIGLTDFPEARTASPLIMATHGSAESVYGVERAGPITFLVRTGDVGEAIERAAWIAQESGASRLVVHSQRDHVVEAAGDALGSAGITLSCGDPGDTDRTMVDGHPPIDEAFVRRGLGA